MTATKRQVLRFGDSLGVTLPADFAADNRLKKGASVFALKNRTFILITPDKKVAEEFQARMEEKAAAARKRAADAQEEIHDEEHAALMEAAVEEALE